MTILTDEERKQGIKELNDGKDLDQMDEQYFRDKLIQGLLKGQSAESLEKTFKQLALLEDALIIYKLNKPTK